MQSGTEVAVRIVRLIQPYGGLRVGRTSAPFEFRQDRPFEIDQGGHT